MAYQFINESTARAAARARLNRTTKTATRILEGYLEKAATDHFDIFLSHSSKDSELVLGSVELLEQLGLAVYVDSMIDPNLDRNNVTAETAKLLRHRMRQSDSLLYLHTKNSSSSKWMPWELGYFDGYKGTVAVLPIVPDGQEEKFEGQEYVGIYPLADIARQRTSGLQKLYINKSASSAGVFDDWKKSPSTYRP